MNGKQAKPSAVQTPVIVSASRATDVPAFFSDWLLDRLREGQVRWTNPFNGVPLTVSFAKTRLLVFWTKNPAPMEARLDELDALGLGYYFHFTLNDYEAEGLEPRVPPLAARVETFKRLSRRLDPAGRRVIWRFDPLMLSDTLTVPILLEKIARLGEALHPYTRKLVFSFADIGRYARVKRNLSRFEESRTCREFTSAEMELFAAGLVGLNRNWGLSLATCGEEADFSRCGIERNRCVDDRLIAELYGSDQTLMAAIGYPAVRPDELFPAAAVPPKRRPRKDPGQRAACGCVTSKDIGAYNTCPHRCLYCYANTYTGREDGESKR